MSNKIRFIYWEDNGMWLGYLEEYPIYMTQGNIFEELKENLQDIYNELKTTETTPCIKKETTCFFLPSPCIATAQALFPCPVRQVLPDSHP